VHPVRPVVSVYQATLAGLAAVVLVVLYSQPE
jgi:hypothetical protein